MVSNLASSSNLSFDAKGTIEGKFDCGYLVSLKVGSEVLSGVLYHPNHAVKPGPMVQAPVKVQTAPVEQFGRRKRKKRSGDPGRPKTNRSAYNFFFAEKHASLKISLPNREREFTKMIGDAWNKLPPEERTIYQTYGMQDKERYQRELKEYKAKMNLANANPT